MKKNVVFIMLDTLQYNYLGCYGNDWIKTPNFDRLAAEGTLFENCYIEGLPTIPCRRAAMTGRYTLPAKGWGPLDYDDTTIADMCWGRGIHTGLIYDTAPMHLPKYGYSRGFADTIFSHGNEMDTLFFDNDKLTHFKPEEFVEEHVLFDEKGEFRDLMARHIMHELKSFLTQRQNWRSDADNYVAVVARNAMDWLERVDKTHPFMLWIDSFDPHEPWDPPSVWDPNLDYMYNPGYKGKPMILPLMGPVEGIFTEEEMHHVRMLYAELVTLCDKWIGKVLDKIQDLGLWDDTLIILTSDHGQPLGNGEHGHGLMRKARPWPYEELAHVPMIVRLPGHGEGQRISSFVQSCDVAPTIADFLEIEGKPAGVGQILGQGPEDFQGHSMLPMIRGEVDKVREFAIAGYFNFSWSIIRDDYSLIHWLKNQRESAPGVAGTMETMAQSMSFGGDHTQQDDGLWTCTPGAEVEVPEVDELYDRKTDSKQLNNILNDKPDAAKELLTQLNEFMAELRVS